MKEIKSMTVLYDERCKLCIRVARRLCLEPAFIPLEVLPMRQAVQRGAFVRLASLVEDGRFVVVANGSEVYLDTKARLMVLWALKGYREFSHLLASPLLYWAVDLAFECISANRHFLSSFLTHKKESLHGPPPQKSKSAQCGSVSCDQNG